MTCRFFVLALLFCAAFAAPAAASVSSSNFSVVTFNSADSLCRGSYTTVTDFVPGECVATPLYQQLWPQYKWMIVTLSSTTANVWTIESYTDAQCTSSPILHTGQGNQCQHNYNASFNFAVITPIITPYIWQQFNATVSPNCNETEPGAIQATWGVMPDQCESFFTSYQIKSSSHTGRLWYSSVDRIACPLEGNVVIDAGITIGECTPWYGGWNPIPKIRIIPNPDYVGNEGDRVTRE